DDASGACPTGSRRFDVRTADDLYHASRGDAGDYWAVGPGACVFVHNGTYACGCATLMEVERSGAPGRPIVFVGGIRDGVVPKGKAVVAPGTAPVALRNLPFAATADAGFPWEVSTLLVGWNNDPKVVDDVLISHVTVTGDCTQGVKGGHLDVQNATHLTL